MKKQQAITSVYVLAIFILIGLTILFYDGHYSTVTKRVMFIATWVIITSLIFVVLLLYNHNRELKENNKKLYESVNRSMELRERNIRVRRDFEDQIRRLEAELAELRSNNGQTAEQSDRPKYEGSSLDENTRSELAVKIITVLDSTDEIFSSEFSLKRLSELVGSNNRYVSQTINESLNMNFTSVLNTYRIKEACRRMNDTDKYGRQTIEAIAEGVGFKSRTSFVTAFKRVTGVTPSEFHKQALSR
jgi:AraC-like DNA-binding protein